MGILIIGGIFAVLLLFAPRFIGRSQEAMLAQYEILEKRFRFKRRVVPSKWGKGIRDRVSISGEFHGYPVALYDTFKGERGDKVVWTSLTFEMLFAGERQIAIESENGEAAAKFSGDDSLALLVPSLGAYAIRSDDPSIEGVFQDETVSARIERFEGRGAFRLSKGFFEYRETGRMLDEAKRIRYQDALMILAAIGDRLSERLEKRTDTELPD